MYRPCFQEIGLELKTYICFSIQMFSVQLFCLRVRSVIMKSGFFTSFDEYAYYAENPIGHCMVYISSQGAEFRFAQNQTISYCKGE